MIGLVVILMKPMAEAQGDLGNIVKDMNERLTVNEEKLQMAEEELKWTKEELKSSMTTIKELEREVSFLKEPPWTFFCGSQPNGIIGSSQVLSYETLLYSSSNVDGAGLDLSSGIFTSGYAGTYTITWSLWAADKDGGNINIFLRKNREEISESRHVSYYDGSEGYVEDQGGRTLVVHLERGDTLDLYCKICTSHVYETIFCVSLSQFDIQ